MPESAGSTQNTKNWDGGVGAGAKEAAAVLTNGLVDVRTLSECETAAGIKDCLGRLGISTPERAARRILKAAISFYPLGSESGTSRDR